jgi:hypothetical protein
MAALEVERKDFHQAVTLLATAQDLRREIGAPLPPVDKKTYDTLVSRARNGLGKEEFTQRWEKTAVLHFEDIVEATLKSCGQT